MAANANSSADNIAAGAISRGIPVEILDREVNSNFLCTVCKLLPRNPVQSFCGHRFCDDCIRDQLSRLTRVILCTNLWFKTLIVTYLRFCHIINSIYKSNQFSAKMRLLIELIYRIYRTIYNFITVCAVNYNS